MRIVQLIDSLEPGGAERMAVNYANHLATKITFSGLVTTRNEGALSQSINKDVHYFFLNKKRVVDIKALFRFKKYLKNNSVTHIHAHSSSFFFACLVKIVMPSLKIIWHDHYGNSEFLNARNKKALQLCSWLFTGIIAVNIKLKEWSEYTLYCANVVYFPNFIIKKNDKLKETKLLGVDQKRIVCLANLRPQKNHSLLIEVASIVCSKFPDWTFHIVGKDFEDEYSKTIQNSIKENNLENHIFVYGSKQDIEHILSQSTIGILTSKSEGLPLALLEYGINKLPVVSTNVGEISKVIDHNDCGYLVEEFNSSDFSNYLERLILDVEFRNTISQKYFSKIKSEFYVDAIGEKYRKWLSSL